MSTRVRQQHRNHGTQHRNHGTQHRENRNHGAGNRNHRAGRRGLGALTAGAGALALVAGLIAAIPAAAAGSDPTIDPELSAMMNGGAGAYSTDVTVRLANPNTSTSHAAGEFDVVMTLSLPGNATCSGVTVAAPKDAASHALASWGHPGSDNCVYQGTLREALPTGATGTNALNYTTTVTDVWPTGGGILAVDLALKAHAAPHASVDSSGISSTVPAPQPAQFLNRIPITIYQDYRAQLYDSALGGAPSTVALYESNTDANGHVFYTATNAATPIITFTVGVGASGAAAISCTVGAHYASFPQAWQDRITASAQGLTTPCVQLRSGSSQLLLNLASGMVYGVVRAHANLMDTSVPGLPSDTAAYPTVTAPADLAATYTVVANNGVDGAASPVAAQPYAGSDPNVTGASDTIALAAHDVSDTFSIPVLFSDVPLGGTFAEAIYGTSISSGNTDGTFRGPQPVTRGQFAKLLAHAVAAAAGTPIPSPALGANSSTCTSTALPFYDVPYTNTFCDEIAYLARYSVINGVTTMQFDPTATITRAQMSAMIYRADRLIDLGFVSGDRLVTTTQFVDVAPGSFFSGDIQWMADQGITNGYDGTHFGPADDASRQASVAFIYRADWN